MQHIRTVIVTNDGEFGGEVGEEGKPPHLLSYLAILRDNSFYRASLTVDRLAQQLIEWGVSGNSDRLRQELADISVQHAIVYQISGEVSDTRYST